MALVAKLENQSARFKNEILEVLFQQALCSREIAKVCFYKEE